jgi:hypothetical protein
MPRNTKFNWDASNTKTFETTIKNFNSKIYYQRKAHPELLDMLPEPIHAQEKKELIETFNDQYATQQDFDRELRSIQRFSRKDATKVVEDIDNNPILNWKKKEIQYKVNNVNQRLKKQREELEKSPDLARAGNVQYEDVKEIKLDKMQNRDWKKFEKYLDKQIMSKTMEKKYDTYKERFLAKLNSMQADTDKAYDFFSRIPSKKLWEARYQKDKTLWATFFYDPTDDSQWIVDNAVSRWRKYLDITEDEDYDDIGNEDFIEALEKVIAKNKGG